MSKIPDTWKDLQLGDICEFTQGIQIPFSEQIQEYQERYIRYLYIRDFFSDKDKCYVKDIYPHKIMKKEDIMIVNTGNTAGSVYSGGEGVLSNNAFKLSFNHDTLNRDYLYQFLKSYIFDNYIKRLFNSAGQPHVGHKNVALVPIQLPPLEEQKKIADILSTVDQKIVFVEENISQTEELKKGLMQKLLTEGIGHTEFKDSEVGRIPESWGVVKLSEACRINMGQSPKSETYNEKSIGLPLIQGNADIKNRKTLPRIFTSEPTKKCNVGDIIMTVRAPVGAVAKSYHNACIGRGVCAITPKEENDFLYHFLVGYEDKWDKLSQGSTFTAVNGNDIKNIKLAFPPLEEQKQIAEILSTVDQKLEVLKDKKESFEELKKGLMQKLLTGEVRV